MGTAETLKAAATGSITAKEARNPYDVLVTQLEVRVDEFAKLLGGRAQAEAFIRVVRNAVMANHDLLQADRSSLVLACMRAAQDGLLPDGREAVLNIYRTKVKARHPGERDEWHAMAQYLPMVAGLLKLIWESGEVTYVDAAAVYERDVFKFVRGDAAAIIHEPYDGDEDPGKVKAAYVIVRMKSGEVKREVMFRRDIERVRAVSKTNDDAGNAKPDSPWAKWYDQQAIKSVIKRIQKQLPKTDRLERAIANDNQELHPAVSQASLGDLALGAGVQPPVAAPPPAIDHSTGEILEQDVRARGPSLAERMGQPAAAPAPTAAPAPLPGAIAREDSPEAGSDAGTGGDPPHKGPSYAQLAARLKKVRSRDVADVILDEARGNLPEDQQKELARLVDTLFPPEQR